MEQNDIAEWENLGPKSGRPGCYHQRGLEGRPDRATCMLAYISGDVITIEQAYVVCNDYPSVNTRVALT